MVARAHDPEGQLQPMEEATAEVLDTGRLSDAAYQHLEWDYQAKFEQAVKVISESLGEPDRADGVATWSVQGGAVSLQYEHQGRATPMRISLVTTPSPRGR
jgi:hypothetical protein